MLFSSSLALTLIGGAVSVVAQQSYGNNHTGPGGNDSLANAPYSTYLLFSPMHISTWVYMLLRWARLPHNLMPSMHI
jgi:hypothetical protein